MHMHQLFAVQLHMLTLCKANRFKTYQIKEPDTMLTNSDKEWIAIHAWRGNVLPSIVLAALSRCLGKTLAQIVDRGDPTTLYRHRATATRTVMCWRINMRL